ncbi:MAG: 3-hydroxyacyl-[acyl-carrier-protein] dehydratase FabZ [Deltaproteobacteria bacterium]|nr:3-hydroxyacyl-ACP dehydratase FabZ [Deltaproteobacteria bacterium]OQY17324.1 MAG: 3-hydroxyacyl-[acyl-carrier-protein] dehydratase FabZ [Desulfobacterium sp. 4572_20]HDH86930.1 3-hydroxyacyl-ACP dehydratase FabZ [Desulfobacteraceae bacterium]MBW2332212.1 3-hydroxyacyl-ACP dehydratase FabZ [Deltaproteobacteria bacterium]MCD6265390.1 3-hydroxyacyl-ACP dehydratase FabZ [Deltaproteobacteria bacterium]
MDLPLTYKDIIKILPHRHPFLFVDMITELEVGKKVVGIKNVTINEYFFTGHFPEKPIMPGVLVIEAMAQVGGILARLSEPESMTNKKDNAIYFVAIDKVRFRKPVFPGDQIIFELTPMRKGSRIWKMKGKAMVNKEIAAEAELVAALR